MRLLLQPECCHNLLERIGLYEHHAQRAVRFQSFSHMRHSTDAHWQEVIFAELDQRVRKLLLQSCLLYSSEIERVSRRGTVAFEHCRYVYVRVKYVPHLDVPRSTVCRTLLHSISVDFSTTSSQHQRAGKLTSRQSQERNNKK